MLTRVPLHPNLYIILGAKSTLYSIIWNLSNKFSRVFILLSRLYPDLYIGILTTSKSS